MTMGKTIFEWAGAGAAVREIQSLTHELLDAFKALSRRFGLAVTLAVR